MTDTSTPTAPYRSGLLMVHEQTCECRMCDTAARDAYIAAQAPASYYVRRTRDGRTSWTGPIRSARQVQKEAAAWIDAGWSAEVVPSTPETRAAVRAWIKARRAERLT